MLRLIHAASLVLIYLIIKPKLLTHEGKLRMLLLTNCFQMKISEIIRNNVSTLMRLKNAPSQSAFARHCGVAQKTINKMFTNEHEIPSTTTVEAVATKNGAAAWMLLLSDFPWEAIQGKPISTISADGYRLLQAFERSSPVTRDALLTHMAFLLQMQEGKTAEATLIMDEKQKYLTNDDQKN